MPPPRNGDLSVAAIAQGTEGLATAAIIEATTLGSPPLLLLPGRHHTHSAVSRDSGAAVIMKADAAS